MLLRRVVAVGALALALGACVAHPVGPARTQEKYQGKATTTAKGALSEVQTVRLTADAASDGRAFGPYVSVVVTDAEEGVATAQGTFDAIQPPGEEADALADELDGLLSDALDHVRDVRLAARRGELATLAQTAAPLANDAQRLEAFIEANR